MKNIINLMILFVFIANIYKISTENQNFNFKECKTESKIKSRNDSNFESESIKSQ